MSDGGYPPIISGVPTNPSGWEYHFCVECEMYAMGSYYYAELDNVVFKQVKDCSNALTSVSGVTTNLVYNPNVPYADFPAIPATGIWDDFFSNQEKVECPITGCTLMTSASSCADEASPNLNRYIESTSPWVFKI